ncbi:MAG: GNAT family N-acetyltransferase [Desulfovibrio sp.]|nr:GNAT family N-acetyltransferase [Desulfovibrio sp.]
MSSLIRKASMITSALRRISGFGVTLRTVRKEDLPLIVQWRNDERVRPYMGSTRLVDLDIMRVWLQYIQSCNDRIAFLAYQDDVPNGFLELRNIDSAQSCCEQGIFINPEKFGERLALRMTLCQELVLQKLSIENVILKIRKINEKNKSFWLRNEASLQKEDENFYCFVSTKKTRVKNLRSAAKALGYEKEWDNIYTDHG